MPSGFAADFLPHGVAHTEDHGASSSSRAAGSAKSMGSLAWWLVKSVPWYLWAMGALYLYGRHVRGNGRRSERNKSRRPLPASENAPRRPEPPSRDVVYRSASPLAMPRPSSPNLERRGSYRRYSNSSMPNMEERPRAGSGLRNAYTPSRSSLSSPRPPPSIEPLQQQAQQEPHVYSTSALPRTNAGASTSALRNAYPSSSAPVVPTVSASRAQQRKRAHDDDESDEAEKRSRVDENGAYDFAQTDDDEPTSMQLDSDHDDEALESVAAVAAPPKRGTKRRDVAGDGDEVDSKRTRTRAPEMAVPGSSRAQQQQAAQGGKKRRASSSGSSDASSPATSPRADGHQQQKKKARKAAIGTGSVRDKRAVDDTSFDEDALELSDDVDVRERNADSDVESADERETAREQEHRSGADGKPAAAGQVKRFRSRRDRSGSDNDDLMGDVEPVYSSSTAASSASSSAPRTGGARNVRLGRLLAKQSRPSSSSTTTPQRARGGDRDRKRDVSPTPSNEDVELAAAAETDTPRKPGDEWTSFEGDRYRIDADGTQRRLCEVREKRLKFRMPKDSKHPDARATHVVIVERWLTAKEYEQAFEHRKLAWQTTFEEEARQQRMLEDESSATAAATAGPDSPAAASSNEHERAMYFTRGVGTPLRAYRNLGEILARPGSSSGAAAASSASVPASPRASPLLANGRMRLASGAGASASSSRGGTPRSASRKWSEHEVKRLLEGEEAARAEREKRRLGYLAMGGDLYETEQERKEREEKERKEEQDKKALEPAKIKLADYAVAPKEDGKAKSDDQQFKPAAPALALPAPAPAPATSAPKPAAPSFFAAPSTSTSSAAPAEAKTTAAAPAPAFSFGAPAKTDAPAAAAAAPAPSMPHFGVSSSAPATSEKKAEAPKPAFSFGAPATAAAAPPAAEKKDEAPKPAPFSFGPSTPAVEKKDEAPKPSLGFGAPAAAAKPVEPAPAAPAPSPFGVPAPSPFGTPAASSASASVPSFGGFGASSSAAPAASASSLNFGSTSAPKPAAPPFSFGGPAAAPSSSSTAAAAASPFSFGAASAAPAAPNPAAPSTSFSFGQPPVASPAASSASAAGGFNFNASTPAAAPSSGFAFGSTPASPAVSGTGSTGFNFGGVGGASPATASPAVSGTFSFGDPAATVGGINFNGPSGGVGAAGASTPRKIARPRGARR
ncbi:hypothetical protein JCM9279_000915 [Rhodotorula babjevae]